MSLPELCWGKELIEKEGKYMTRIAVATDENNAYMASDSLFINSITGEKRYDAIKICQGNHILVGILGASEFFTDKGVIKVKDIIEDVLDNYQNIFDIVRYSLDSLKPYYMREFMRGICTQMVFLYKEDDKIYCIPAEISYRIVNFGFNYFGPQNLNDFEIKNQGMIFGDYVSLPLERYNLETDAFTYVKTEVEKAISNPDYVTIGGVISIQKL